MTAFDDAAPSRRDLLMGLATAPALAKATGAAATAPLIGTRKPPRKPFVAIQIGGRSFVDEGVDKCLDTLQATGGVNAVMAAVFTYGGGLAGRQGRGAPLPDHGVQEYDRVHGGSYTKVHPEFYANSIIKDIRAPDLGEFDVLADVIPKAKAKGMQTYALFEENYNPALIPNWDKLCDVDIYGRTGFRTCFNNPYARTFLTSMVSDWVTSNDIDGLMWESERQGPLNLALGLHFGDIPQRRASLGCFCGFCMTKAREQGIDGKRAREGYVALDQWVSRTLKGPRDTDGTFQTFWRLLLDYPEILAWHRFWGQSQEEVYALIYGTAKRIKPELQVGWHIMHLVQMSPFYVADNDFGRLANYADFIKPCPYNNCAGPRLAEYVRNAQATIYRDMTPDQVLEMTYRMMGLNGEPSLAKLPITGLSGESVGVETRRAIAAVKGEIPIYPGIDIDIPTAMNEKRTSPADVKAATLAAFRAGAPGVVLSRKYAEMRLTNIAGAKAALKELRLV